MIDAIQWLLENKEKYNIKILNISIGFENHVTEYKTNKLIDLLVEGLNINGNPTGTIYNEYIASGDFFKIPQTIHYPSITYTFSSTASFLLDYDYLYY